MMKPDNLPTFKPLDCQSSLNITVLSNAKDIFVPDCSKELKTMLRVNLIGRLLFTECKTMCLLYREDCCTYQFLKFSLCQL